MVVKETTLASTTLLTHPVPGDPAITRWNGRAQEWRGGLADGHRTSRDREMEPAIVPGEVHVWSVSLARGRGMASLDLDVLSAEERARTRSFRFERDRDRFVAAHVAVRTLLARYLHIPAGSIVFTCDGFGKPSALLPPGAPALRFNLSHSEDHALIAVTCGAEVGVDCECVRKDLAILDVADRFFAEEEIVQIRKKPQGERCAAFFRCWTRKEALIKGIGWGLSLPLDAFTVDVDTALAQQPLIVRGRCPVPSGWVVMDVPVMDGYAGAVAVCL